MTKKLPGDPIQDALAVVNSDYLLKRGREVQALARKSSLEQDRWWSDVTNEFKPAVKAATSCFRGQFRKKELAEASIAFVGRGFSLRFDNMKAHLYLQVMINFRGLSLSRDFRADSLDVVKREAVDLAKMLRVWAERVWEDSNAVG